MNMNNKKKIIILLLVSGIIVAIGFDLFMIFNKKKNVNENKNNEPNTYFVPATNIERPSYNCAMNGASYTPFQDIKVYMYDIEGNIELKYNKDKASYIVTGKENYKFIDLDNYLANVEEFKLFKNHEYERDDVNTTIKLDYEELVDYDNIFNYMEQLKEIGYNCSEISNN